MNTAKTLERYGVKVQRTEDGRLSLSGLQLLAPEVRAEVVELAKKLKEEGPTLEDATPSQLAEMYRLLVRCPVRQCRVHCWNCGTRCPRGTSCTAWHGLRQDVEFFQGVPEPASFMLWESWIIEKGPL